MVNQAQSTKKQLFGLGSLGHCAEEKGTLIETHSDQLHDPRQSPLNVDAHVGLRPTNPPSHKIKSPRRQTLPPYRRQHSVGEVDFMSNGVFGL